MMKLMNKKLTKKGFTLAELLIVVAILAILVAVSIPIFTSKLHDAKDSTDLANIRAAKAAAVAEYMSVDEPKGDAVFWYDAKNGTVQQKTTTLTATTIKPGYNQCTKAADLGLSADASGKDTMIVEVTITGKTESTPQKIETKWVSCAS